MSSMQKDADYRGLIIVVIALFFSAMILDAYSSSFPNWLTSTFLSFMVSALFWIPVREYIIARSDFDNLNLGTMVIGLILFIINFVFYALPRFDNWHQALLEGTILGMLAGIILMETGHILISYTNREVATLEGEGRLAWKDMKRMGHQIRQRLIGK